MGSTIIGRATIGRTPICRARQLVAATFPRMDNWSGDKFLKSHEMPYQLPPYQLSPYQLPPYQLSSYQMSSYQMSRYR
uniref:Uncharacterized protein n=1 Tax=Romanomermis culicivorax TaxID=13658 RepID=A0A915LDP4_ROMCU